MSGLFVLVCFWLGAFSICDVLTQCNMINYKLEGGGHLCNFIKHGKKATTLNEILNLLRPEGGPDLFRIQN